MADSIKADLWKALKHPHTRPWLAVVGEVPATFLAHHFWGHTPIAGAGMAAASVALTAATWWAGEGTGSARRLHATASTAAGTLYLTVASLTDPLGDVELSLLALGGATAAASWNVRKSLRVNPEAAKADTAAGETGLLVKSLGKAKLALRGEPKIEPNKVTAPYKITDPGSLTNADLGRRIENLAGELGISPNAIRIKADPDNAAEGEFVFVPKDMLTESHPYPGPSSMGGSITEPLVIGVYEDGASEEIWLPWDPNTKRNATHFGVFGMNGSAKSSGMVVATTEALTRRDLIVWACDPAKGAQTFGPLLPYLDWVEMSTAGGEAMIDALGPVITARADALGRAGYKNWTPNAFDELDMPYMIVWIEEAAKFFRNGTEMEGLVQEARSAGISVFLSLQRPSATSMPTDVREQLGGVLCFGVKGSTTADMALPDDVRDAGARPEAWENRKPGYNYLVAPGVDEERYAMKARTFVPPSDDEIDAILSQARRPSAGPITITAAGEAYANRAIHTPDTPLTSIDTKETIMSKDEEAAREEANVERSVARQMLEVAGDDGEGLDLDVDPDQDIPPVNTNQVWTFNVPKPVQQRDLTPDQAQAELLAMLDEYREEGRQEIGPKDFAPYGKGSRIGRSRAWISGLLNDIADEHVHLEETEQVGVYKLLYPQLAAA